MINIIFITLGVIFVISITLLIYEIKRAPLINDDKTLSKDDTNHYMMVFCKNCRFFDRTAICLNEHNFGEMTPKKKINCERKSLFEAI